MKRLYLFVLASLLLPHAAAAAGDPKLLGAFGGWNAYAFDDGGKRVCFMSSKPVQQKGEFKKRGEVLLFITRWPDEKLKNIVSVSTGYSYRPGSEAELTVGGKAFKLATSGETASSKDPASDDAITAAIRKGDTLTVQGVSARGTLTTDTYKLDGADAAFGAMTKECSNKG